MTDQITKTGEYRLSETTSRLQPYSMADLTPDPKLIDVNLDISLKKSG